MAESAVPQTRILETSNPTQFEESVSEVVRCLSVGGIAAIPTETVYGLAADGFNPEAVARIYEIKGRPAFNPIILHVSSLGMLRECVSEVPEILGALAESFWPGPLTVVLPRSSKVPDIITAGGETVALRWPGHPFMREVIRRLGRPVAAPSANLSTRLSPTTAEHVLSQLDGTISLVVDAGACNVGIESTVVDLTVSPPVILRPGIIDRTALSAVLPGIREFSSDGTRGTTARSPGQMLVHYAPQTPLVLFDFEDEKALLRLVSGRGTIPEKVHILTHVPRLLESAWGNTTLIPEDPEAYARALYAELYRSDVSGSDLLLVERPPESGQWAGIHDRLRRASCRNPTKPVDPLN